MTALHVIAIILGLQLCINAYTQLWAVNELKTTFKRLFKRGDVEQDMDLFDDGYLHGILDYLNDQWINYVERTPGRDDTNFRELFLSPANDLYKIKQIGQFSMNISESKVVFDEWPFRKEFTTKN